MVHDLRRTLTGELGRSLISREPVAPLISSRFCNTLLLAGTALLIALVLGVFLGLAAAETDAPFGRAADLSCTILGALSASLPIPWVGPMLMYLLSIFIPILPVSGHLALPSITLGLSLSGFWSRMIRERVRERVLLGSVRGARARGLPEWKVLLKHGLAPNAGFLLAWLGTQAGTMLSGAFISEALFDWPGMGSLLVNSVLSRDYPVVEAAVFVGASASLAGTLIGDWAQTWLDPRLRSSREACN